MFNVKKLSFLLVSIGLAAAGGYLFMRFIDIKKQSEALKAQNIVLAEEKTILRQRLSKETKEKQENETAVVKLQNELSGLQDTKKIKDLYLADQEKLKTLTMANKKVREENIELKQSNLSLDNRLANLTEEFTQTLETLKSVKQQLSKTKGDKAIRGYVTKIEQTEAILKEREEEISVLKQKVRDLQKDNVNLADEQKVLEKKVASLEKQIKTVKDKYGPHSGLNKKIRELNKLLIEKEREKRRLKADVTRLRKSQTQLTQKLSLQDEKVAKLEAELLNIQSKAQQIKKIENDKAQTEERLVQAEEKLAEREKTITALKKKRGKYADIDDISSSPDRTTAELQNELNKAYALYDTAKAQVVKFSEMLMQKEVELETAKQKIKALERGRVVFDEQPADGSLWQDRIKMLNASLKEKDKQLQKKDEEIAALKMARATLEERLSYQENEFENANILYTNLKQQMMQTTQLLSRREETLVEKNKEILELKSELALLEAEFKVKQQELIDARAQQRRTMEDLTRATKLNITLQENMVGRFENSSIESRDKEKAEKLKEEVETLLGR